MPLFLFFCLVLNPGVANKFTHYYFVCFVYLRMCHFFWTLLLILFLPTKLMFTI